MSHAKWLRQHPPQLAHDSNARFIAAAPDMCEALERVVALPEGVNAPHAAMRRVSQRAIAKANGETE